MKSKSISKIKTITLKMMKSAINNPHNIETAQEMIFTDDPPDEGGWFGLLTLGNIFCEIDQLEHQNIYGSTHFETPSEQSTCASSPSLRQQFTDKSFLKRRRKLGNPGPKKHGRNLPHNNSERSPITIHTTCNLKVSSHMMKSRKQKQYEKVNQGRSDSSNKNNDKGKDSRYKMILTWLCHD